MTLGEDSFGQKLNKKQMISHQDHSKLVGELHKFEDNDVVHDIATSCFLRHTMCMLGSFI